MEEAKSELPKRTYNDIMGEMTAKFSELIDKSRRGSAPLDLTQSGVLLPDYENFLAYLEQIRVEIKESGFSEKDKGELIGVFESRKATAEEY